jgi:hypothetical protein
MVAVWIYGTVHKLFFLVQFTLIGKSGPERSFRFRLLNAIRIETPLVQSARQPSGKSESVEFAEERHGNKASRRARNFEDSKYKQSFFCKIIPPVMRQKPSQVRQDFRFAPLRQVDSKLRSSMNARTPTSLFAVADSSAGKMLERARVMFRACRERDTHRQFFEKRQRSLWLRVSANRPPTGNPGGVRLSRTSEISSFARRLPL